VVDEDLLRVEAPRLLVQPLAHERREAVAPDHWRDGKHSLQWERGMREGGQVNKETQKCMPVHGALKMVWAGEEARKCTKEKKIEGDLEGGKEGGREER
jgi:hypothetical protein